MKILKKKKIDFKTIFYCNRCLDKIKSYKGITLSYDGKLFEKIAEQSLALDTGARELSNTVNNMFEKIIYDVISNPGRYSKCTISIDIVNDNTKYVLS